MPSATFELPWPWGGERFEVSLDGPITFLTGSLGSGKTRLAQALAEHLPDAVFVAMDRSGGAKSSARETRIEASGGTPSPALASLLVAIEAKAETIIVDMVEQGLDTATQRALVADLRNHPPAAALVLMTRSTAILDLTEATETILYCPANHSPPLTVRPVLNTPGYGAVSLCLASPEMRAGVAAA